MELPKKEQLPQKLWPIYSNALWWRHKSNENKHQRNKTKTIPTKNIYNTIVGSLTKNYLLVNEARWNLIDNNKALNWKKIWQNTFKAYNIPYNTYN